MAKKIDLNKSVYELASEYPELIDIMYDLGFTEISKKAMLNSVGKFMTIPKGAKMKNISMIDVVAALMKNGFELEGEMPMPEAEGEMKEMTDGKADEKADDRVGILKGYLRRLNEGEDLESVRADFVKNFSDVEASEIMQAEQQLIKEGAPLTEVQKLCDVHSALFHGATAEEKTGSRDAGKNDPEMSRNVAEEMAKRGSFPTKDYSDKQTLAKELSAIPGHPLNTFTKENEALAGLLAQFREDGSDELLVKIRELSVHYAKKGDLIYPHLKVRYDVSGPSNVMWTVDDEIRAELGAVMNARERGDAWEERRDAVLKRAEEMIYKEQNILFPICAVNFTEYEWFEIYRDSKDYDKCFGVVNGEWKKAEDALAKEAVKPIDGEIVMPGGHMTLQQLTALLNTIPVEITFIDADDINRFFNEGPKAFKRPGMAIDRDVFSCHPPKIEPMVRAIIDEFKSGKRDSVTRWANKNGRTMLVQYFAVRDRDGSYIGTAEFVQDMEFAKEYFTK